MNERVISVLRGVRTSLQVAAEPIDILSRWMNGKKGYPPLWIRQKVGSLNDFEGSGGEYMAYLKLLCGLKPGDNILDIGCGCGLICLGVNENGTLPEYISPGLYWGMDTDKKVVRWCERNVRRDNVRFTSHSIRGMWDDNFFDVILAKSLFTHLLSDKVEDYLRETKRLLKPGGKCLATFFLLRRSFERLEGRYTFKWVSYPEAFERITNRRVAVAYDEKWLLKLLKKMEFSVDIYYGSWRGDNIGLSFQDVVILRR